MLSKLLRIVLRLLSWAAALAVLAGLLAGVRLVFKKEKEKKEMAAAAVKLDDPVAVRVAPVGRGDVRDEVVITGNVEADQKVNLISKVPGRVEELRVAECSPVKKGEVLAVIDHEDIAAEVARAEAAVVVAKANIKAADVAVEDAAREKTRMENLFKEGATNQQNMDRARTAYDAAVARQELAAASLQEAGAALKLARVKLDDATIRSPLTGVVSQKKVDQGNMVGRDDVIATVVDISSVKILMDVSEKHLKKLRAGETLAHVGIDSLPGESFSGKVQKIYPAIDPRTRSARLEIRVENPNGRLMPGMYARARLVLEERKGVIVAPVSAMVSGEAGAVAFILQSDAAKAVPVELGIRMGNQVEVRSGLKEGDRLVVEGQTYLEDGRKVRVVAAGAKE